MNNADKPLCMHQSSHRVLDAGFLIPPPIDQCQRAAELSRTQGHEYVGIAPPNHRSDLVYQLLSLLHKTRAFGFRAEEYQRLPLFPEEPEELSEMTIRG